MWVFILVLITQYQFITAVREVEFIHWFMRQAKSITVISDTNNFQNFCKSKPFMLFKFKSNTSLNYKPEVTEGIVINATNIEVTIEILHAFLNYPHKLTTNFLIYLTTPEANTELFAATFKLRIKRVVVLHGTTITHHNHFKNKTTKLNIEHYKLLDSIMSDLDYNGHKFEATLFVSPPTAIKTNGGYIGIDAMILRTVARRLNLTLLFHEPYDGKHFGSREPNGEMSGSILELYNGQCDIGANQMFLKYYNAPELRFTAAIFMDKLCVVVPKAGEKPDWMSLFATFEANVWILMGLFSVLTYLCFCASRKSMGERNDEFFAVVMDVIQIIFNVASHKLASKYLHDRILIGNTLLFALLLSPLFQGSLYNQMRYPHHFPDVNTLFRVNEVCEEITSNSPNLKDTFTPAFPQLAKKLIIANYTNQEGECYLSRNSKAKYVKLTSAVAKKKHIVKECPQVYLLAYLMRHDSLFYWDVTRVMNWIFTSGLVGKWIEDSRYILSLKYSKIEKSHDVPTIFNMADLQATFYILVLGLSLSTITFWLEFCLKAQKQFDY